jgi:tripartite-type tricarboxylate transporter receptor subunit TctC
MKLFLTCTWLVLLSLAGTAFGQTLAYPSKPVRIIISFPPGGSTDFLARILAERLQSGMQQTVIVENRPGGNSVIAAETVAKAAPDGHTLFMAVDSVMSLNPLLYSKLSYDPERDFVPISHVASQPFFMVAGPRSPVRDLPSLIAYARANPGKLTYGTSAMLQQLAGEKIKLDTKVDMLHVPFKGSPPMLQALLNGEIDFAITATTPYANYVKEGRLFGIATSGGQREMVLPTTPVMRESGFPDLEFGNWNGLYAPAGTPNIVIEKLNAEVRKAMSDPAVSARLIPAGIYPSASTPDQLRSLRKSDIERWGPVIRAIGIKLD